MLSIPISKSKLRRWSVFHSVMCLFYLTIGLVILVEKLVDPVWYQLLLGALAILFLFLTSAFPLYRIWSKRKLFDQIISLKDGILQDHSSLLHHKKKIAIENIASAHVFEKSTKIGNFSQAIVHLNQLNKAGNAMFEQLRGRKLYFTDFWVDREKFNEFFTMIKKQVENKKPDKFQPPM